MGGTSENRKFYKINIFEDVTLGANSWEEFASS